LTYDLDFQSQASWGHDPNMYKNSHSKVSQLLLIALPSWLMQSAIITDENKLTEIRISLKAVGDCVIM